jgi:hypothetical protein
VKVLKVFCIVVGVVLAGVGVGWLGTRTSGGSQQSPSGVLASNTQPTLQPAPVAGANKSGAARIAPAHSPLASSNPAAGQAAASTNLITNWEDKLDEILSGETEDPAKARQMLEMFPRLPEDGQIEVAQHLSNLVPDDEYGSMTKLLANTALPESVLDILLSDALNRPNSLKLPALLAAAQDPRNPKAGEAKDLLELFLEEDYGNDWSKWRDKMGQWLRDNPD